MSDIYTLTASVTSRAVIRNTGAGSIEVRVHPEYVGRIRELVAEHMPAESRVDVKPLSHEAAYTSRITLIDSGRGGA